MRDDVRAQRADGARRQVVRVDGHSAREDQEIRARVEILLRRAGDHGKVVVADRHAEDLGGIVLHLRADDRLKLVFDPACVNLGAGNDHAELSRLVGPQVKELSAPAQRLGALDLRLLRHERHDAHGRKAVARLDGEVVGQGRDRQVADGVDLAQQLRVHAQHPALVRQQKHLALGRGGVVRELHGCHRRHAQRGVLLVDFAGVVLPDEDRPLAEIEQLRDVLLRDDVTALERGALEAVAHGGDVVAEGHADGVFNVDLFHIQQSFHRKGISAVSGRLTRIVSARSDCQSALSSSQ